jgi:hypothetical protein
MKLNKSREKRMLTHVGTWLKLKGWTFKICSQHPLIYMVILITEYAQKEELLNPCPHGNIINIVS